MKRKKSKRNAKKKITIKYCPSCKDVKMVKLKSGDIEIFECVNCKFRVRK